MRFIFPRFLFKVERWKWNKHYGIYVSNLGHFRDENKKPIPIQINYDGYVLVNKKLAHRVVMNTWMPILNAGSLTVDHLNHNKRDNSVDNLEWVTREENQSRAKRDFVKKDSEVLKEDLNRGYNIIAEKDGIIYRFNSWNSARKKMKLSLPKNGAQSLKSMVKAVPCYNGYIWKTRSQHDQWVYCYEKETT